MNLLLSWLVNLPYFSRSSSRNILTSSGASMAILACLQCLSIFEVLLYGPYTKGLWISGSPLVCFLGGDGGWLLLILWLSRNISGV